MKSKQICKSCLKLAFINPHCPGRSLCDSCAIAADYCVACEYYSNCKTTIQIDDLDDDESDDEVYCEGCSEAKYAIWYK